MITQTLPAAGPAVEREGLPLSAAQRQLWLAERMQPGGALYTIPVAYRLRGRLDRAALDAAWTDLVHRHEVLRTVYAGRDGEPTATVLATPPPVRIVDLDGAPESLDDALSTAVAEPFDLTSAPAARLTLFVLAPDEHALLLCVHHIAFDGVSVGIALHELSVLYAARTAGTASGLAPLPMQYSDFARWEQRQERSEDLAYWREVFVHVPPRLQLETDRPRPAQITQHGATLTFPIPDEVMARVDELSAEAGVTPFITLLAAFHTLLARYTGQPDLTVGVPLAGRPGTEFDGIIGCFANLVAVRVDLAGDPSFRTVIDRVGDAALDAFQHMGAQFDQVVAAVDPERDPAYLPLVQVTFGMQDAGAGLDLPAVTSEAMPVDRGAAEFDLTLDVVDTGDGWIGDLEYNTDLYDRPTVERLVGHWLVVLAAAIADPGTAISALPLLDAGERALMLGQWNATDVDFGEPRCLHEMFAEVAARTPDATAVVVGDTRLSYRELDERANRLARLLVRHGAGPETSVGVCMPRSEQTIVAFLAALKSGGVYLPMDPEYPPDRLAFMVRDADVGLLVTDAATASVVDFGAVTAIRVDEDAAEIEACPATAPATGVVPENLSCAFYTSGSSGKPKCALLTHANYVNYVNFWHHRYLRETPMRVHLQMTSFAFDIFIADASRALLTGATLLVCPREIVMAPARLYQLMRAERVNSAEFITPILAALVDHVEEIGGDLEFLDLLVAGSDIWYAADFVRARKLCGPRTKMIAAYGLSETSIDNTTYDERDQHGEPTGIVPIGRPADNTQVYVLNEHMQPLPVGIPGELYVGGAGVGRGYLNRPALTATKYLPDPFSDRPGARLYASGDLARYRPDGVMEILGRVDNQVKVGGFRIELGEIESALRDHPAVDNAVVVVRTSSSGAGRLVGYYTAGGDDPGADLTAYLRGRLPGYMVPAVLLRMAALPLSANGKVDRRALPSPDDCSPDAGPAPGLARTPSEEVLAGIWSDVLGGGDVGIDDDFFRIGGRSLLMTRVVARIADVWDVNLPVRTFYQHPTVRALAREVDVLRAAGRPGSPPLRRVPRDVGQPLEVSFAQRQMCLQQRLDQADAATYNVPVMYQLDGPLDAAALGRALTALVGRHEILRTSYVWQDGRPRQRILEATDWTPVWTDLASLPPAERDAAVDEAKRRAESEPVELSGLPIRCSILRLTPASHIMLLTLHHVATDGWSLGILLDELSELYAADVAGTIPALAEADLQYADYAHWQRTVLTEEVIAGHLAYWRRVLAGAPAATILPTRRHTDADTGNGGAFRAFDVPPQTADRLRALSRAEDATLFMTLFAAFTVFLQRQGAEDDIVVGAPTSGRGRVEVERMLGFFVNVLPLRTDLSGDPTFRAVLGRVRQAALSAYDHQDLPFEKVVELVRPPRVPYRHPVFQTVFSLEQAVSEHLALPGVTTTELPFESTTAKFDLLLEMTDGPAGLCGGFSYKTGLFDAEDVDRLVADWLTLLATVVADPTAPIGTLPAGKPPSIEVSAAADWSEEEAEYVAPRTLLEGLVAAIWSEAMDVPRVGVRDDFFVLGGYSLLGGQLTASLQEVLGAPVPLRELFGNPTVELLSAWIERTVPAADLARITEEWAYVAALPDSAVKEMVADE